MAVARVFEGKGWTPEQYDELIEQMDLGGRSARGVLFHWSTQTSDGMRAIDVYESREAADRLVAESVGPIAAKLGLSLPEISEYDVHAYVAA